MKQMLWLSLIPLTAFWLFAVDVNGYAPALVPAIVLISLGIAISVVGFLKIDAAYNRGYAIVLLPILLSCFIIPYPYSAGLIVIALAFILSLFAPRMESMWLGTLFAGLILTVQSLSLSIYYIFAPNLHQLVWLTPLLSFLTGLTGLETTSNSGLVYVYAQKNLFPFTVTLEKIGFYPWILIFVGAATLIFLTSQNNSSARRILGVAFASLIYLLVRYALLIPVFFATDLPMYARDRIEIYINPVLLTVSFIPLVILLLGLYPVQNFRFDFSLNIDNKRTLAFLAVMVSVFCLTAAAIFQDPGEKKEGRILVDEIHSLWEPSTLKLDKEWYGEYSTYNAYSIIEWLNETYDVDRIVSPSYENWSVPGATKVLPDVISDRISDEILNNYDILIIKTPSQYQPQEVDSIVNFVENGGGLLLIGDHTNFAGTSTNLNRIAARFGLEFGFDSVNTINGELYHYRRGSLPHPCAIFMPDLDFMTGCSLRMPLNGEPVVLGFDLSAEPGEYASSGFFRETRSNDPTQVTNTIWGLINQAVALKHGRGRVVAFSDSTIISNFRAFFGGTPNFMIGCMEYLNYRNSFENMKQILFLLGIIIGSLAVYLLGKTIWGERKIAVLVIVLALGALAVSAALLSLTAKTEGSIPGRFYASNHTVCFDGEHSDQVVSLGNKSGEYETFFVWTQRVNLTPSIEDNLGAALEKGRILVIVDPIKPFSREETDALLDYAGKGNSVFLMLNETGPGSPLTQAFGMDTYIIEPPLNAQNETLGVNTTQKLPIKPWGLAIEDGEPLLTVGNRVVLAAADRGKGKFVLFTDSQLFRDGFYGEPGYMGYSGSDPHLMTNLEYNLRSLYNLEYRIFEDVLGR